jgi:hypothetical protein
MEDIFEILPVSLWRMDTRISLNEILGISSVCLETRERKEISWIFAFLSHSVCLSLSVCSHSRDRVSVVGVWIRNRIYSLLNTQLVTTVYKSVTQ